MIFGFILTFIIMGLTIVCMTRAFQSALREQRVDDAARTEAIFGAAMKSLAAVQERVVAGQNESLERVIELVHGPKVEEEVDETGGPAYDIGTENLPPWFTEAGDDDAVDPTDELDPDPIVVDEVRGATMVRPGESMVP